MYSKDEIKVLRKEFWLSFSNYTKFYSSKIGVDILWLFYKTGIKGVELKFDIDKKSVKVILEINSKSKQERDRLFNELFKYKSIISDEFNDNLLWKNNYILPEGKVVSRVYIEHDCNYYNKSNWPNVLKFMCENMYRLQTNFLLIKDVYKESVLKYEA